MPQAGSNSYLILGEQGTDWDTPVLTAGMKTIIYEFLSNGLRNVSTPIIPTRFTGNPSPIRQIDGTVHAEGALNMHLHAEDMLIWWQHIFMATASELDSVDFTAQEVFADAAYTDPDSLDTQPAATSPASDPGKLIFTFSDAQTGTVAITGTDQNGVALTETLTFTAETTQTTTSYFQTVDADGLDFTGISTGTLQIDCDKNTYTHTLNEGDTVTDGFTIESVKGSLPSTYIGCLLNSGVVDIADVITLTVNMLAKRGWNRAKVPASGTVPTDSVTPTDVSAYSRVYDEVYPAWSLTLTLDTVSTPVASASFTFNNQLVFPTRFTGIRTQPQPVRSANRDITLVVGIDYDTVNPDMDAKFWASTDMAAVLKAVSYPYGGPELSFQLTMPRCQIAAYPDPEVSDYSEILQELSLRPIRTAAATASDEIELEIVSTQATP